MIDRKRVGKRINEIRINQGLTLEQFGALVNATKSDVYRWEKGYHLPNKKRLKVIALKGGIEVTELLQGNGKDSIKEIVEIFKSLKREEKEDCLTELLNLDL